MRVAVAAASLVVGLALAECAVRWLLFHAEPGALARRMRQAEWYARGSDAEYWTLQALFSLEEARPASRPDPRLGWMGDVVGADGSHPEEAGLGDRRPVLLFGDSFAQCVVPPDDCFQGLLARSELASGHALLNYGVGGYGLDQIALLLERVLPRFAGRDPIVLVGVFVDDDLERCALPIRGWPKPRFRLVEGQLVLDEPGDLDARAWVERHPPRIASYALRLVRRALLGAAAFDPTWTDLASLDERRAVCRAILARIAATLDAQSVERRAFVVFDGPGSIRDHPRARWQRETVVDFAETSGTRCVRTAPFLLAALDGDAARLDELFVPHGTSGNGHYDEGGNRVAFEALRSAIEGTDEVAGLRRARALAHSGVLGPREVRGQRGTFLDRPLTWSAEQGIPCVRVRDRQDGAPQLSLRPGPRHPTAVSIELRGETRLRARARGLVPPGEECGPEPLELVIASAEGATRLIELVPGGPAVALDEALSGHALRLEVRRAGPRAACAWIVLEDVRLGAP